ncbi:MAG TPA: YaiI/YqxD family protein [Pirellulaceae bacterium]
MVHKTLTPAEWNCLMQIWVDADACPGEIKELLYRAAQRTKVKLTLVANQSLRTPRSEFIETVLVPDGMNVADRRIVELIAPGDLVVTADIPLAADVVTKGAEAIDPRGRLYSALNIGELLAMRNIRDQLRGNGLIRGGPPNFGPKDRQAFANQLDRWIVKHR